MQIPATKRWYPRSVLIGDPVTTEEIAERLAIESTVAPADVLAVLRALSGVMGDYMAHGQSVRLDGIGTFYFSAISTGNSVSTPEEVTSRLIKGVRVRFRPEASYSVTGSSGRVVTRALTKVKLKWYDIDNLGKEAVIVDEPDDEEQQPEAGTTPGGGDNMEM